MSAEAARLLGALQQERGEDGARRVTLPRVWRAFHQAFSHRRSHPEARAELAGLLRALAEDGALRLPRAARGYDQVLRPRLPLWIGVPAAPHGETALQRAARQPWHPALDFVRALPRLAEGELRDLLLCQRFLARVEDDEPELTARERSLRLFGDEKRLDRVRQGQLFQPGRLSAALLRCRFVHVPFVSTDFGGAPGDALILENADTYHSACAARRALGRGPRWILFGCGNAILKSAASLRDLTGVPARLLYFGDLDWRGLEIAWELARIVDGMGGLPPLRCAAGCYQRLCEFLLSRAHSQARQIHGEVRREALLELLPATLRDLVAARLEEGSRWAQEWISQPEWLVLLLLETYREIDTSAVRDLGSLT